jgi:hypothetical protein
LVVLGDGAPWIWNLASRQFPTATQIVDLYHAREHLHEIGALVAGDLGDNHPDWLAERLAELDSGDIAALLAAARNLALPDTKAAALEKALNYFETNSSRMRLRPVPRARPFRRIGSRRGRVQSRGRTTAQTIWYALVNTRRLRHCHPAMPRGQRAVGRDLVAPPQPGGRHAHSDERRMTPKIYESVAHPRPTTRTTRTTPRPGRNRPCNI